MAEIVIRELNVMTDAGWSFNDSMPVWRHGRLGSSGRFDPFPAYPHDVAVVREMAERVQRICPPRWDVELYVADREELGRSNGYSNAHEDGHYDDNDHWVRDAPSGLIMLSGKRVPPHPAMTRYLVAHEYGHNVEWMLNDARGERLQGDAVVTEYAKMRGMSTPVHHGSGGRWHDSAAEVFACDFRILVCDVEEEFWPHPGVPHPRELPQTGDLIAWWAKAQEGLTLAD